MADVEQAFYLEKQEIVEDSDEDYRYEEVPVDDDYGPVAFDEDLDTALRSIQENKGDLDAASTVITTDAERPVLITRPEVVDDFVRNFLVRMKLQKTLECFQCEWYELQHKGLLRSEKIGVVPDVYAQNEMLNEQVKYLKSEADKYRNAAFQAKEAHVNLRKERDYHRMHHKRVVQEKNKLISDIKRLQAHYASYEPAMRHLKTKYETAMKEKMLTKLEKDRAVGQVNGLQNTLKNIEGFKDSSAAASGDAKQAAASTRTCKKGLEIPVDSQGYGPSQRALVEERKKLEEMQDAAKQDGYHRHPDDSEFPTDLGINPLLSTAKNLPGHLTRTGGFRLAATFQAHSLPISSIDLHPRKQIIATTSDDHTWKMFAVPSGDLIMTGEGHTDWVSCCNFHPSGGKLATGSGDTTVKIWDFAKAECVHTFVEHKYAVWGVSWHSCGDFLASCSMDNSAKVWDLHSLRCRYTLRGHTDSVNSVQFLPFANTLLTCSADKTLSLWDARTGLCAQTFYGHAYSVNHCTFNARGDVAASCDSYGSLKLFDVRAVAPLAAIDVGPHPANHVAFDPSGSLVSVCSNDSTVKMYELATGKVTSLIGHEDAVQAAAFDRLGDFLVSGGSDLTVRLWS